MKEKPHHGRITSWFRDRNVTDRGLGYVIIGKFMDHPTLGKDDSPCHTSCVLAHDDATGEIETLNSRYTLVGDPLV